MRLTLGKACRIISLVRLEPKFNSSSKQQPVGASGRGPNDPAATCATALSEPNVQNAHEGGKRTFIFIKSRTMVGERTSSKGWTTTDVRPTIGGSSGQSSSASPSSSRTRVSTSILSMSVALDGPPLARGPISWMGRGPDSSTARRRPTFTSRMCESSRRVDLARNLWTSQALESKPVICRGATFSAPTVSTP